MVVSGVFWTNVFAQAKARQTLIALLLRAAFGRPGPDMPTQLIRAVGVYFTDGNFYTMGGGPLSDTQGSDFQHVLQFSTGGWHAIRLNEKRRDSSARLSVAGRI